MKVDGRLAIVAIFTLRAARNMVSGKQFLQEKADLFRLPLDSFFNELEKLINSPPEILFKSINEIVKILKSSNTKIFIMGRQMATSQTQVRIKSKWKNRTFISRFKDPKYLWLDFRYKRSKPNHNLMINHIL